MKGELVDVLDASGAVVASITREEAERDNHTTPNVLVFLFNAIGRVWLQLRPMTKNHYPGKWDISTCGGIVSGETPAEAATRETFEETGLRPKLIFVETFLNVFPGDHGEERRRLSHLFIGRTDELPVASKEADDFKAWDVTELKADLSANPDAYIPSLEIELDKAKAALKK